MKKLNIKDIQDIAKKKNGECLSENYINGYTKLLFKCNFDNYKWLSQPDSIRQGHWCPECAGVKKLTIEEMRRFAKSKDGKCLSENYINNKIKLEWECKKGHIWKADYAHIVSGRWCPKCARKKKLTIEEMDTLAQSKDGECLSKEYINNKTKLKWKCNKDGNIWDASAGNKLKRTWCPLFASKKTEYICKEYLENKTKFKFPKCRPLWLNGLELDGYCKELNLAFEYNGIQHYRVVPFFHKTKKDFESLQERDRLKKKLCKENNIKLIIIPHNFNCYDCNKLYNFIDRRIKI